MSTFGSFLFWIATGPDSLAQVKNLAGAFLLKDVDSGVGLIARFFFFSPYLRLVRPRENSLH